MAGRRITLLLLLFLVAGNDCDDHRRRDTLDALLRFLRVSGSPVKGVMELRGLLMAQKEEKILLASLVDQMRVDLQGIRLGMECQRCRICCCPGS